MSEKAKQIIEPVTIDVGLSPDVPGVVSILTCEDGTSVIHGLPPQAALAYGIKLQELARQLIEGSVRIPSVEQKIGASLTVERSRTERLDS